ncbi:helix-turn-helix domain-containing protein [Flavobacterium subsaxonicum]|uniref:DNA-binding protein n=1 Tax=Flavobacterium subsaxonicum WB 4.1-42 = DSM 21790 TaxID=1121898 RepID=A0A0A2MR03_9FLAO|nr:helix-turn-helix transcriptional regulator [Flavobacterium subsaxonicum]KGO94754.1 DNA-binding protein [Flavobacterium subsaxonicum WB 4.1-42 = DSM 21790]
MVNAEDFIKRLEILLDYYSLSASLFADKLGVQRSGLSHLMSGRNKPSLDFVMKIVENFPEVDLYWLLAGVGEFPKTENQPHFFTRPTPAVNTNDVIKGTDAPDLFSVGKEVTESKSNAVDANLNSVLAADNKDIERIVIFYSNGSFKSYTSGH